MSFISLFVGNVVDGLVRLQRASSRCLAHIQLAGHHIRDEPGAVFAENVDLAFEMRKGVIAFGLVSSRIDVNYFCCSSAGGSINWKPKELFWI